MRSIVIISILALSVLTGFIFQIVKNAIDRKIYPQTYSEYVQKYSIEYGVPEYIIYSTIKVESGFESNAVSPVGAVGLMQIMPDTFRELMAENKEEFNSDLMYGPETNIRFGTYYLSKLYIKYKNWDTVYAAYNAGPNAVDTWLSDSSYSDDGITLKGIPFSETANYVEKMQKSVDAYLRLYYR